MQSKRWASWVMAVGLLAGCAPKPPPPPPPPEPQPLGPEQINQVRADLRRNDPNAQVGQVAAVMPEDHLAAITDVPVQDFQNGQALNVVDGALEVIAQGIVDDVKGRYVVIRYQAVKREPRKGDLAIRVSEHRMGPAGMPADTSAPTPPPPQTNPPPTGQPQTAAPETSAPTGATGATAAPAETPANQPAAGNAQPQTPAPGGAGAEPAKPPAELNK